MFFFSKYVNNKFKVNKIFIESKKPCFLSFGQKKRSGKFRILINFDDKVLH